MDVQGCTRLYNNVQGCKAVVDVCTWLYKAVHGIPFHSASLTLGSFNLLHRHRVVQDCILLHKVVHCCTILDKVEKQLYKDVQGCTMMHNVVKGCTRLYKDLQGYSPLYNIVPSTAL